MVSKRPMKLKKRNLTKFYRFFTADNLLNREIFTDSNKLNSVNFDHCRNLADHNYPLHLELVDIQAMPQA